jgi:excisionase family DNA binding protein
MQKERVYTTHEIGDLLDVDPSTVGKWINRGLLMAFRTPGRHRRVRASDLRAFLQSHEMPVPDELGSGLVKLLIVDDEKPVLEALKRSLKPFSDRLEIVTTTSGVDALLQIHDLQPHGLLIDLNMPDLDGMEVCRRIRARKTLDGIKLIAMTGRADPKTIEAAIAVGVEKCLAKPIDLEELLALFRVPMALARRSV